MWSAVTCRLSVIDEKEKKLCKKTEIWTFSLKKENFFLRSIAIHPFKKYQKITLHYRYQLVFALRNNIVFRYHTLLPHHQQPLTAEATFIFNVFFVLSIHILHYRRSTIFVSLFFPSSSTVDSMFFHASILVYNGESSVLVWN